MSIVIVSAELGVFVGSFLGLGLWTNLDTGGRIEAVTFESKTVALEFAETWDTQIPDLEFFYVRNGHWRTLIEDGLPIGDMAENERRAR